MLTCCCARSTLDVPKQCCQRQVWHTPSQGWVPAERAGSSCHCHFLCLLSGLSEILEMKRHPNLMNGIWPTRFGRAEDGQTGTCNVAHTSTAAPRSQWAVVMSRNSGFSHQCVELDFQYSSEGVHRRWDEGVSKGLRFSILFPILGGASILAQCISDGCEICLITVCLRRVSPPTPHHLRRSLRDHSAVHWYPTAHPRQTTERRLYELSKTCFCVF